MFLLQYSHSLVDMLNVLVAVQPFFGQYETVHAPAGDMKDLKPIAPLSSRLCSRAGLWAFSGTSPAHKATSTLAFFYTAQHML